MDGLGARINPSLVSFMVPDHEAIEHEEAPVSTTPTPTDRVNALPLSVAQLSLPFDLLAAAAAADADSVLLIDSVIEGETDVDGYPATPALSQNRARDVLDLVDTAFHGSSNSPIPAASSQPTSYATAPLYGEVRAPLNPIVANEPWLWNMDPYMAWQQHNTTAHLISPSPAVVPSVLSPNLSFPFFPHVSSFPDWSYGVVPPYMGYGWDASAAWSSNSTPQNQVVYEQRYAGAQPAHGAAAAHGRTTSSSSLRPGAQAFTPCSPQTLTRQLLMFNPGHQPALVGGPSTDCLGGFLPTWGMTTNQPFYSQGPSINSYNPSETGSSHSYSTYISRPSSRGKGPPMYATNNNNNNNNNSMARTNSTQSNRPLLLPKRRYRHPATPSLRSEDTNTSPPRPLDSFPSGPRGKRCRSLSPSARQRAKNRRDQRSVCVRCKISGISCQPVKGATWCKKCEHQGTESSCTVFYFKNMVDSTRFTENHSICRPLLHDDDKWRIIDFGQLLKHVERMGRSTVIRAMRDKQVLYDLDLGRCHRYLTEASSDLPPSYSIQSFVQKQKTKKEWETCVRIGDDFAKDALGAIVIFDDSFNETTFRLVHCHNRTERFLNPDNDHDRLSLLVAHVLSLTFGRQVELATLAQLHRQLSRHQKMSWQEMDSLAHQLFTMRWAVSLDFRRSAVLSRQPPSAPRDAEMVRLEKRIKTDTTLCHRLYMCFCCLRQKRERKALLADRPSFVDRTYRYAGTLRAVTERLPKTDSSEAFETWMSDGRVAVEAAGELERVRDV